MDVPQNQDQFFLIGETLRALEAGQIILYPTDTVWGIGCDATNTQAVSRILDLKARPATQGLISLVDSLEMLRNHVDDLHPRLQTLLAHYERPLTVVYAQAIGLPLGVVAGDGSAAIRMTSDPYCKRLIAKFGRPIVSTSANLSGEPTPTNFSSVSSEVKHAVDHVVKFRQRDVSIHEPSVIARWTAQNEIEPIRN